MAEGMAQVVEDLPHEALSSNSSTDKKRKERRKEGRKEGRKE
jgi:hypothetical protein